MRESYLEAGHNLAISRSRLAVGHTTVAQLAFGQTPTKVLVADQRQRWGGCGGEDTLRFNFGRSG